MTVEAVASAARTLLRRGRLGPLAPAAAARLDDWYRTRPVTAVARTCFGADIPVHTGDFIQRFLHLFGVWEPHLTAWLSRRLAAGDVCVGVGANVGYVTLLASRLVGPRGGVVAVEASPVLHRALARNVCADGGGNVRTVNRAVHDTADALDFYLDDPGNLGSTSLLPGRSGEACFRVGAARLAELLMPGEIARARIIKIDVEGAEAAAVRSAAVSRWWRPGRMSVAVPVSCPARARRAAATSGPAVGMVRSRVVVRGEGVVERVGFGEAGAGWDEPSGGAGRRVERGGGAGWAGPGGAGGEDGRGGVGCGGVGREEEVEAVGVVVGAVDDRADVGACVLEGADGVYAGGGGQAQDVEAQPAGEVGAPSGGPAGTGGVRVGGGVEEPGVVGEVADEAVDGPDPQPVDHRTALPRTAR